jgi:hypothetical protein
MLQDVIDRVNQARKLAQTNPQFQQSAKHHAEAIESQEAPPPITKKRKNSKKIKSLADVYRPYFDTDMQH